MENYARNNERKRGQVQCRWSQLPQDLLESVMVRLVPEDNFSASEVCRAWSLAAMSVRAPTPLMIFSPKTRDDLFEFYDPLRRRTMFINMPELLDCVLLCCQYGWLLVYRKAIRQFFFFNPFSRQVINLTIHCHVILVHRITFSAPPTSPSCIVCAIASLTPSRIAISTYTFRYAKWKSLICDRKTDISPGDFYYPKWNTLVFCSGSFYCMDSAGYIWTINPHQFSCKKLKMGSLDERLSNIPEGRRKSVKFMTEHHGALYITVTGTKVRPRILRVDVDRHIAREVVNLGNRTLFASLLSSHFRTDAYRFSNNTIYFSKVRPLGKRSIRYSLDDRRYYPNRQGYDWNTESPFEALWIQPPQDLSEFIRGVERIEYY